MSPHNGTGYDEEDDVHKDDHDHWSNEGPNEVRFRVQITPKVIMTRKIIHFMTTCYHYV